jgi:hypothetical protein
MLHRSGYKQGTPSTVIWPVDTRSSITLLAMPACCLHSSCRGPIGKRRYTGPRLAANVRNAMPRARRLGP